MIKLLIELSYQKSWGRNEILKLGIDDVMQHNLSSAFHNPVMNRGDAMFELLNLYAKNRKDILVISTVKCFKEQTKNVSKDDVISFCISQGLDGKLVNAFSNKLRATNSKRHLVDKMMITYLETYIG